MVESPLERAKRLTLEREARVAIFDEFMRCFRRDVEFDKKEPQAPET